MTVPAGLDIPLSQFSTRRLLEGRGGDMADAFSDGGLQGITYDWAQSDRLA